MSPSATLPASVEFRRFRVFPHRREVLRDARPIELGGRAFDVLMALIDGHGGVVTRSELMRRVWPGTIVDENNLHSQISALRKALAADGDLIRTIPGRGYQFIGEIRALASSPEKAALSATVDSVARRPPNNLPEAVSELIGREAELAELTDLIAAHRLVTLTGTGGIGKTRLALEVARRRLPEFPDGVWLAELAPLSDPELIPVAIVTALGLEIGSSVATPERVAAALGAKRLLLVLDNCEHVINVAARMAEALLHANSAVRVLATSREPLRAEGEYLCRISPLAVPAEDSREMDAVLQHGAVRLFDARVRAADPRFAPTASLVATMGVICRRLDGIPLAIELAASRAGTIGLEEIAARLDDRFRLLAGGRRTALRRHQTLRATLDWSYDLLPELEGLVLRRLATFAGSFTLEAASAVAADAEIVAADFVDAVANLVTKSLVVADVGGAIMRYRLLETTRAYALEKLAENGEFETVAQRHAEYCRDLLERAETEWETRPKTELLADYGWRIVNIRAALDWAFSSSGDAAIGVALTVAAVPLWVRLSLLAECRGRVEQALTKQAPGSGRDICGEMKLYAALGTSLLYTKGAVHETGAAWTKVLEIAQSLDNAEYQLRALWGLWAFRANNGEHRLALALAKRFSSLATRKPDRSDLLIGDRMVGFALHYLGDQANARRHIERMLCSSVFQHDQRLAARAALARILWLQGFPDQAMSTVRNIVEDASAIDHEVSRCNALAAGACPVAFLAGDLAAAEHYVAMLLDHSTSHALDVLHVWARSFHGALLIKRGDVVHGLRILRTALDELSETAFALPYTAFLGELAEGLGRAGRIFEGLAAIDEALARSERTEARWCLAELLRIKAELTLAGGLTATNAAEDHFHRALDCARRQGALSWELRAATSLARLWQDRGRAKAAHALLAPIYGRFTEGFATADLKAAKALLDSSDNERSVHGHESN